MTVKALKVRIVPSKKQQTLIDTIINCCRFIYNYMLARNSKIYKRRGEHLNYNDMQNLLPEMKKYLPWLKAADSQALKYACRQLDDAFQRFFKRQNGYPKFKSKKSGIQSYTTTNAASIHYENGKVKIPCLGWLKVLDGRELPEGSAICKATVKRDHGQYYVSITYKTEKTAVPHAIDPDKIIGFDYKSNGLYVDSNGDSCDMPHYYRDMEPKIAKAQRQLSKKVGARKGEKPSGNYKRAQSKLFKNTRKAANQRKDLLHKKSTEIANRYDAVCVEDLNMKAMSNKGFGNGKATLDNGYGMFLNMLEYKLHDRGKAFIRVDKWFPSSQICSECGCRNPAAKDLSVRKWTCPECGTHHDRDHNAAKNIRAEGIRMLSLSDTA